MFAIRFAGRVKIVATIRWTIAGVYVQGLRAGIGAAPIFLSRSVYDALILPNATARLQRKSIAA